MGGMGCWGQLDCQTNCDRSQRPVATGGFVQITQRPGDMPVPSRTFASDRAATRDASDRDRATRSTKQPREMNT